MRHAGAVHAWRLGAARREPGGCARGRRPPVRGRPRARGVGSRAAARRGARVATGAARRGRRDPAQLPCRTSPGIPARCCGSPTSIGRPTTGSGSPGATSDSTTRASRSTASWWTGTRGSSARPSVATPHRQSSRRGSAASTGSMPCPCTTHRHSADRLRPRPGGGPGKHVLCTTRLEGNKRPEMFVDAMAASRSGVPGILAGRGTMAAEVNDGSPPPASVDRIDVTGFVDDATLIDLMADAVAVVYAPLRRGLRLRHRCRPSWPACRSSPQPIRAACSNG